MKYVRLPRFSAHVWAQIFKFVAIVGGLFIIFMLFKINANSNQLAAQAKAIAEQNQRIAKANGSHIDCIADLFARYTREGKAISINDLNTCQVTEAEVNTLFGGTVSGAVDFTTPAKTNSPAPTQSTPTTPSTTPTPTSSTPTSPAPVPEQPKPLELLGVPVCVPFTGVCVR